MAKASQVVETISDSRNPTGWTLQRELVNCGKCKACQRGGYPHGPYWYAYHRRHPQDKPRSVYLGLVLPEFDRHKTYDFKALDNAAKAARKKEKSRHAEE